MTGHTAKWLYQSLRKLPDAYRGIQPIFFDCDKHFTGPVRTGKIENKEKVVECLKSLIALREQPDQASKHEAREIFLKSIAQQSYAFFAEALLARLYSIDYEKNILQPLEDRAIDATTVKTDYDTVLNSNKEIANMLARIINVYAMKVAHDSFQYYGRYELLREQLLEID